MDSQPLLTPKQVAARLTVSPATVYALASRGDLPCKRIGLGRGAVRFVPAEVEAFLGRCDGQPGAAENAAPLKHFRPPSPDRSPSARRRAGGPHARAGGNSVP